jgi:hypothetical protein
MRQDELLDFLTHVRERQAKHSAKEAFKFKAYADRQGTLHKAKYDRSHATEKRKTATKSQKARRADKKAKKKQEKYTEKKQLAELSAGESDNDALDLAGMRLVDNAIDHTPELTPPDCPHTTIVALKRLSPPHRNFANALATPPHTPPATKRPHPRPVYKKSLLASESPTPQSGPVPAKTVPTTMMPTQPEFALVLIDEETYKIVQTQHKGLSLDPIKDPNTGKPMYEILPAMYDEYQSRFNNPPICEMGKSDPTPNSQAAESAQLPGTPRKGKTKASDALREEEAARVGAHLLGTTHRTTRSQVRHK